MRIHESTTPHACAFLSLKTRLSASVFYIKTPAPASAATHMHRGTVVNAQKKWLNKVIIFVFFVHKVF